MSLIESAKLQPEFSARALTAAGAAAALLLGHRSRPVAAGAGLALPAGSACTRFGALAAGTASAEDPAHTVGPQREAAEQRSQRSQ
ncbi:hypothetical protein ACFWFI_34875 [Streptomyces sp. NPDC060209]|uniref:hypothetical protein n=1 Tax=Streptomyces sp. NPDC060209 TaxID=3347073 RepID=UPI00365C5BCA